MAMVPLVTGPRFSWEGSWEGSRETSREQIGREASWEDIGWKLRWHASGGESRSDEIDRFSRWN